MWLLVFLKLTLAPLLVAGAGLVGRRFGPRVAGWLIGFPVVAGPILWFYAHEQGNAFAARAASGTALGVVSLSGFLLAYAWASRKLGWVPSLLVAWVAFAAMTLLLASTPAFLELRWPASLLLAYLALAATQAGLPSIPTEAVAAPAPPNLGWRMLTTALLVLALTTVASALGPALSGLFTPFPVATTILVVFAHREQGAQGVLAVYAGFIPSLYSFTAFCAALSWALERWAVPSAFIFALMLSLLSQAVVLARVARARDS